MSDPVEQTIIPRHPDFTFDDDLPLNWHPAGPAVTQFYNTLSLTFPEGERFFVDAVKHYRKQITDPQLLKDVRGFAGQEAIHSNEHVNFNKWLARKGLKPEPIERAVRMGPAVTFRWLPHKYQLALTCALEHFTALFAEQILSDPEVIGDAPQTLKDIWTWHALEEAEHKAVAFDVYTTLFPGWRGYIARALTMGFITLDFTFAIILGQIYLMYQAGDLWNGKAWRDGFKYQMRDPGVWRKIMGGIPEYFKPSFHPNDRSTDELTTKWRQWYAQNLGAH